MKRLNWLLDLCMDVYIEEEQLVLEASMMFRSRRALDGRKNETCLAVQSTSRIRQLFTSCCTGVA